MSSTKSSSTANSPGADHRAPMSSYYSDAASELGRKLTLDSTSRASPTDDMRTRLQAQRETRNRPSVSSRAPAKSSSSKGKGKASASAEPSRRQPLRESTRRMRRSSRGDVNKGKDDDDDDDDDSDESDDSDDSDPGGGPGPPPRISDADARTNAFLAIMSAFEPGREEQDPSLHVSPYEFTFPNPNSRVRPGESSRTFRSLAVALAASMRTPADVARLGSIVPLNGSFWGSRTVDDLWRRARNAVHYFRGDILPQRDALDTIREFRRLFASVDGILRTPPLSMMHADFKASSVNLLAWIFDTIATYTGDVPRRGAQATVVYAGDQFEYNLFARFAHSREDWSACLDVLRHLIAMDTRLFNADAHQRLAYANQRMAAVTVSSQVASDFVTRFRMVVQGLG